MLALLLISGKKLALEISPKLENELCKSAYYPSKNRNTDYVVTTFIDSAIQKQANKSLLESLKEYDADYGCVLTEGVEWIRRFPISDEGYLIRIDFSPTTEF